MYKFFLGGTRLPVPPTKMSIKIKNENKTVTVINEGEVNLIKAPGLSEISFQMLIPQTAYPFANYPKGWKGAQHFLTILQKLKQKRNKKGEFIPFQFIVTRKTPGKKSKRLFKTNLKVTLEDYTINEDKNQGRDLVVDIRLRQWRPYGTKKAKLVTKNGKTVVEVVKKRAAESAPKPKTVKVQKGDTLFLICKKYLGDGNRYKEVYALNQKIMDAANKNAKSKYTVHVGQVLTMPKG